MNNENLIIDRYECSKCKTINKKEIGQRLGNCPECDYSGWIAIYIEGLIK